MTFKKLSKSILAFMLVTVMLIGMTSCDMIENIIGIDQNDDDNDKDYSSLQKNVVYKTENFEIDGAMLKCIFNDNYKSISSYTSYLNIDTSESLRDQAVVPSSMGATVAKQNFGDDVYVDGTWFDLLWDATEKEAKQILAFCEAAKADGIELSEEEIAQIDSQIESIIESNENYFQYSVGRGITAEDARRTMLLTELSNKYAEYISEKITNEITDDEVIEYFEENQDKYTSEDLYYKMKSFAHIIITERADDESTPAKFEAERILEEFLNGEMTREAFEKLMKEKTNYAEKGMTFYVTSFDSVVQDVYFSAISPSYSYDASSGIVSLQPVTAPSFSFNGCIVPDNQLSSQNCKDTDGFYDVRPNMLDKELDEWLFDDEREIGDTAIIVVNCTIVNTNKEESQNKIGSVPGYDYHVMWYIGEGEELWFLDSKSDCISELIENKKKEIVDSVDIEESNIKKVKNDIAG